MAKEKAFFGATKAEIARFKREVAKDNGFSNTTKKRSKSRRRKGR